MKKKSWIAIGITLFVGVLIEIYIGSYRNEPDLANKIAVLLGASLGYLFVVIILPLIISMIKFFKEKTFPYDTFVKGTYAMLVILTIITIFGLFSIKSAAQSSTEGFKNQAKLQCIELTASVYDQITTTDKAEMKNRAKNYCICLYDKISDEDLNSVIEKELLLPELLNLQYQSEQDLCFDENYSDINTIELSDLFKATIEKREFWKGRLLSYYLLAHGKFNGENFEKLSQCIEPTYIQNYSKMIPDWEKRELSATEIFNENPEIMTDISNCYKDVTNE